MSAKSTPEPLVAAPGSPDTNPIRRTRVAHSISLRQLARLSGLPLSCVGALEYGQYPSAVELIKRAKVFGCDPASLVELRVVSRGRGDAK